MTINIMQVSKSQPITVRGGVWDGNTFDDDWCNHAGAYVDAIGVLSFDSETNNYSDDDSIEMLCCDKCDKVFEPNDDGGEWL